MQNWRPSLTYCKKASQKAGLTERFESKDSHKGQSFQEYFTSEEPNIHQMWAKTECPGQIIRAKSPIFPQQNSSQSSR